MSETEELHRLIAKLDKGTAMTFDATRAIVLLAQRQFATEMAVRKMAEGLEAALGGILKLEGPLMAALKTESVESQT
jgi:hypothetical protein